MNDPLREVEGCELSAERRAHCGERREVIHCDVRKEGRGRGVLSKVCGSSRATTKRGDDAELYDNIAKNENKDNGLQIVANVTSRMFPVDR